MSVAVVVSGFGIHGEVHQCVEDSPRGRGASPMLRLASSATQQTVRLFATHADMLRTNQHIHTCKGVMDTLILSTLDMCF